ncbi:AMP-binding protein [Edaphosphingomonas haloaromaticamans]|uniref:3-methylmercaptopropionyl-CoA ligase n=1 Tax=Edaphosphingomonas haloaromaticamans TaxID=653954 RepID=A0A1S1HD79_9SPHN|nr:AMP-binding protein [Sphingomonas haloaromaticamans]OHT19772.1 Long-chain-fatty-acid--CoA ligase [Sphingomonas haloaromaticamans]
MTANHYSAKPWLRLFPEGQPHDHQARFGDMLAAFRAAVADAADRTAIRFSGSGISFGALDAKSDRLAGWAAAHGVKPGDRIAIILQNVPAAAIATVAAWKLGAIPVPGNPMYRAAEIARQFGDSRPALLICHEGHAATIGEALAIIGDGGRPVLTVPEDGGPGDAALPGSLAAALAEELVPPPSPAIAPDDLGLLLYTSGTTGVPKAAMIRHESLAWNSEAMSLWYGIDGDARILGVAPMFHITGFVMHLALSIAARATLILFGRFDPARALATIRAERPTWTVGAITAYNALAGLGEVTREDFASFRRMDSGGAPIAPALRATIADTIGHAVYAAYGMTETASVTHSCPVGVEVPVDPASGAFSVGIPFIGTEAMVADEAGRPVPVGETGEIWMRGRQIMAGYWNKPEETAATLTDGWMRSGDVGFMDEQGWFYVVDRKKDCIIASGFKVWPREVEDALHTHPAVREAAVVGAPDAYRGETVVAHVSLRPGAAADEAALIAHCRDQLAAYKVPRAIRIAAELPKTATGKIQRNVLREAEQSAAAA